MRCHRYFGFIVFALFASLFCTSLFTADSYATVVTCDSSTFVPYSVDSSIIDFSSCDRSSLDSSKHWYYYGDLDFTFTGQYYENPQLVIGYITSLNGNAPYSSYLFNAYTPSQLPSSPSLFVIARDWSTHFKFFKCYYCSINSFTLNISDSISFGQSGITPSGNLDITENGTYDVTQYAQATVNVENEVIYADYHDDLVNINHSIIICAATILVLYFFYCIYRMIIKGAGVK